MLLAADPGWGRRLFSLPIPWFSLWMAKKKRKTKLIHPLDLALGKHIRDVRKAAGVSQDWVARECGHTIQQQRKYEIGTNRVSWSRLCEIADALDISVIELITPVLKDWKRV